jgi:DNA repair protein RadA/Sms
MSRNKVTYLCEACGYAAPSYLGRCPECQGWNTFSEQISIKPKTDSLRTRTLTAAKWEAPEHTVIRLSDVEMETAALYGSGYPELDRVLGGGIMPGGYVLVGGDPGIGKSTLMLQVASEVGKQGKFVLYIAGEESPYQIKMRAERLNSATDKISVLPVTNIQQVVETIKSTLPQFVVVDSIQAMYCPDVAGTPGSVSQIKECAAILMEAAKTLNVPIFLIGHVTKEGVVSGPKLLEHTVDAVLYFEGDKYQNLRILRSVKNRFGSTQEIGVFEMAEGGLREISNPSELFLSQTSATGQPGSVIAATIEGSRPILVEIQALVGQSAYSTPRRIGNGIEYNRLHQIIAVLERRLGLDFSRQDVYINVVGGMRIDEPAADLAVAVAIISSLRNLPVIAGTAVTGEIGLTGEIRPVRQIQNRLQEAARIGFSRMLIPNAERLSGKATTGLIPIEGIETIAVATMADAIRSCFVPRRWDQEQLPHAQANNTGERDNGEWAKSSWMEDEARMEERIP